MTVTNSTGSLFEKCLKKSVAFLDWFVAQHIFDTYVMHYSKFNFHDGDCYHVETSPLTASVMKELMQNSIGLLCGSFRKHLPKKKNLL